MQMCARDLPGTGRPRRIERTGSPAVRTRKFNQVRLIHSPTFDHGAGGVPHDDVVVDQLGPGVVGPHLRRLEVNLVKRVLGEESELTL
jgi:hypothetical protein